jgi:glycosyltransferase involved in cell wall biosynthesis
MNPYGGTEIQVEYLHKYVSKELLNKVQITTSIPEKTPLLIDKTNILWVHNSYDQPNVMPWFQNKLNHGKYDWYVFNSHWTYEKFRYFFSVPTELCLVIKNGFDDDLILKTDFKPKDKIKLIYTSTPWRGLDVLLDAMAQIKTDKVELDVYSSTQIYGDHFKNNNDKQFIELYDKAKSTKNVNYKGYLNHKELMKILHTYDVYMHPSIFEETFCMAAMESLACGLVAVTTDLGALYETCAEFPIYVPHQNNRKLLASQFAAVIDKLSVMMNDVDETKMKFQQQYYRQFYHWNVIKNHWENFLNGI